MKKLILSLVLMLALMVDITFGQVYQQEYTTNDQRAPPGEAQFAVTLLKYEPYPVNPGSYFDLWIKVDNIGNGDATNAKFELAPKYPFSSTDNLVREYGKIVGNRGKKDENNQVVLKYRVKVADDSPEGNSEIEFKASTGNIGTSAITKELSINIERTETDFDVVMQDSTAQGTALAISNIGSDPATAVTVTIKEQEGFTLKGPRSSIVGNLDKGDFTTLTFQITPQNKNTNKLLVQIDYTDIAGVRHSLEKQVQVDIAAPTTTATRKTSGSSGLLSNAMYIGIGLAIGIVVMVFTNRKRRRKI